MRPSVSVYGFGCGWGLMFADGFGVGATVEVSVVAATVGFGFSV
jgi:hypothetical protein